MTFKRILSLMLTMVLLFGMCPNVLATGTDPTSSTEIPASVEDVYENAEAVNDLVLFYSFLAVAFWEIFLVCVYACRSIIALSYEERKNPYLLRNIFAKEAIIHGVLAVIALVIQFFLLRR